MLFCDDPPPIALTGDEQSRLELRERLRTDLIAWWNERSRDAIENTPEGHVNELLTRVVMPVLDAAS